eukprot:1321258-Rhodomonas_salina.1
MHRTDTGLGTKGTWGMPLSYALRPRCRTRHTSLGGRIFNLYQSAVFDERYFVALTTLLSPR